MKTLAILLSAVFILSCNRAAPVAVNVNSNAPSRADRSQTAIAHTTENQTPKPANGTSGKWTQSGDPIDTSKLDEAVVTAEKEVKAKASLFKVLGSFPRGRGRARRGRA